MTIMHWYTAGWLILCAGAAGLLLRYPFRFSLLQPGYWRLILEPWKVLTFSIATISFMIMAPYTGDPTWDWFDALFMSVLTYVSAPWCVGVLYRSIRRQESWQPLYVALCCWFFSASWAYDLYIWVLDGMYPLTWTSNIVASSFLYLMAGLLWNLEWIQGTGLSFAFMHSDWPLSPGRPDWRIVWLALPVILIVAVLMARFLTSP